LKGNDKGKENEKKKQMGEEGQANIHPQAHVKFCAGVLSIWLPISINMIILRLSGSSTPIPSPID